MIGKLYHMKNILLHFCILLCPFLFWFTPVTAQNIPDFLVNEQGSIDGSRQSLPDIGGDGSGNYVITWVDARSGYDYDIFAQIYLSNGTSLGSNFKINDDEISASQYNPAIAVDPNLNFVITWKDRRNGDWNDGWDIYAQRFSNDGTALGENFKVNDDIGNEEQEEPAVSIDNNGNFVIVWSDERNGAWDIYAQRFSNDGIFLGSNFKVNDDTGNLLKNNPSIASNQRGDFVISWADKRDDYLSDIFAQRYSANGAALGDNFKVNTDFGNAIQHRSDISIDGDGKFIIAWEDRRNDLFDIFFQCYSSEGSTIGENIIVGDNPEGTDQRNVSISSDIDGNFNISWQDDRNDYGDVFARQYSNEGVPYGNCFKVNTDSGNDVQFFSEIFTNDNGDFRIVWEDQRFGFINGEIYGQAYLNDGLPVEDNFKVNDDVASENQRLPSMAIDSSGNLIYVWVDFRSGEEDIFAQRFSGDGTAIGSNFKVNDDTTVYNYISGPSVAASPDGSFVISWTDGRSGYCLDIYSQLYSANGTPLGNNFLVSYLGYCHHLNSAVACKTNGDFIITWNDEDEGGFDIKGKSKLYSGNYLETKSYYKSKGSPPDVYAQIYLSDGTAVGENFMVNEDIISTYQKNPAIAVDVSGNFIITWQDDRNGPWHIYAQRFLSDGTLLGSNFTVEDYLYLYNQIYPSVTTDEMGNFFIAWQDFRNDNYDIFCRRFLSNGTPIESSFQVNSDTGTSHQSFPCISAQNSGDFIVTWTDTRDGTDDVYAQRYWNNGTPYEDNFQIPNANIMLQSFPCVILDNNRIYTSWQDNHEGQTGFDIWANMMDWDVGVGITEHSKQETVSKHLLYQNNPNPFYSSTVISYSLIESGFVTLNIYDLQGRKIESLVDEFQSANSYSVFVNVGELESGIYLYTLEVGNDYSEVKKMILIR